MNSETLTIPWLENYPDLQIAEWRDLGGSQFQITVSGGEPADRRSFEVQLTMGRTAIIHNGATKHVGAPTSGGDQGNGRVTVTVTVDR